MPRTPAAARPMGRTSSSLKRMVWPERLTMKMSSPVVVSMTRTNSSPSRRLRAMMPSRRDESYSVNTVRLTWPSRVAKNKKRSPTNVRVSMMARIVSPATSGSRLTMGMPFAVRSLSGMSMARSR